LDLLQGFFFLGFEGGIEQGGGGGDTPPHFWGWQRGVKWRAPEGWKPLWGAPKAFGATEIPRGSKRETLGFTNNSMENKTKHIWIFLSAFGVFFATLSWIYEIATQGFWLKGALAVVLGFILYKLVINKV